MKAALPLAAADYHSDGPHISGVVASFKNDHRVTDKEFWRALTSHRTCAVKTDI